MENHVQAIQEIKSMMERSSRFISLSGLSGVSAGIFATLGALAAYWYLGTFPHETVTFEIAYRGDVLNGDLIIFFLLDAFCVLTLSIFSGVFFTVKKTKNHQLPVWTNASRSMVFSLLVPLITGGVVSLILVYQHLLILIAPIMLIFYGMALINASKYTLKDVYILGVIEMILGLLALIFLGYGLLFWTIGFGLLHIFYGAIMYLKYDFKAVSR